MSEKQTYELEEVAGKYANQPLPEYKESVAHLTPPENYLEAAKLRREEGGLVEALHCASVAEGIATTLAEITGVDGLREGIIRKKATKLRMELVIELVAKLRELTK